jgi:hypothetical protein
MDFEGSDPVIDQAKIMVMRARERLYEKCHAFFSYILATMTSQSKAVVQAHPDFTHVHLACDVFVLARIVRDPHLVNLALDVGVRTLQSAPDSMTY